MVVVTVSPQLFKTKLTELGIFGLSASGSFGRCPICSRGGVIKLDSMFWYTCCCRNSGSLIDLAVKLKHQTTAAAENTVSQMLQNPADISTVMKQIAGTAEVQKLWDGCKALNAIAGLNSFAQQIGNRLEYNEHLSYSSSNIHHQVRAITNTEALFMIKSSPAWMHEWLRELAGHTMNFVVPSYNFPGNINGLLAYRYENNGTLSSDALVADGYDSLGLFANNNPLMSDSPLVVTSDLAMFSKLVFWQNARSGEPGTFAYIHVDGLVKSQPTALLLSRQAIYWGDNIDGEISRFCYDLKLPVTSWGIQGGNVKMRDLTSVNASRPFDTLKGRAASVESYITSKVRHATPQEAAMTLASSLLPAAAAQVIASEVSEETCKALQVVKYDTCPLVQSYVSSGTLEQRVDGWHLSKARSVEVICSHSFRVKELVSDGNLIVELFYCNQWIEFVVDREKFHANAFETVRQASAAMVYFTYDLTYTKHSANWCLRLNPMADKPVNTIPVGVDIARRTLSTNSLQIQGYPVSMSSVASGGGKNAKFLHLADGQTPDIASVGEVIQHKATYRCLTMLAVQILRYFNGESPYVVAYGEKLSLMVSNLLAMLDINDSNWPCDISNTDKTLPLLKYKSQIDDNNSGMWLPIKPANLYWITGVRDVVYIGHTMTSATRVKQRQLHRILVSLIFEAMRINEAKPLDSEFKIVSEAWQRVVANANTVAGTAMKIDTPSLVRIQMIDAVSYWLQHAYARNMITVSKRRLKKSQITDVTICGGAVTFRRDLINLIFTKSGLPNWKSQDVVMGLHNGPGFMSFEENFGQPLLVCSDKFIKLTASSSESATG